MMYRPLRRILPCRYNPSDHAVHSGYGQAGIGAQSMMNRHLVVAAAYRHATESRFSLLWDTGAPGRRVHSHPKPLAPGELKLHVLRQIPAVTELWGVTIR